MNNFERRLLEGFRRAGYDGTPFAVALSGGADSVALLVGAARLHGELPGEMARPVALHCNFGLRGDESDGDEAYCRDLCNRLGVHLSATRFDVAASRRPGQSVEMVCRELRYDWFGTECSALGLAAIAVAHHSEDSDETMLLNLLRGTGPLGMRGLSARNGGVMRPMLDLTRPEIEAYLAELGIPFRTDSSNLSNDYRRNALRNVIIPEILRHFPAALEGLRNTREAMAHSQNALEAYTRQCYRKYCRRGNVDIEALRANEPDPEAALYYIGRAIGGRAGISMPTVRDILRVTEPGSRYFYSADRTYRFCLHRGILMRLDRDVYDDSLTPEEAERTQYAKVNFKDPNPWFTAEYITREEFDDIKRRKAFTPGEIYLDAEAVLPLAHSAKYRPWRHGDRIQPFGMRGTRLVSDILTDLHLTPAEKERVGILTLGDTILWIVGIRASRHFPVTPSTTLILRLTATP